MEREYIGIIKKIIDDHKGVLLYTDENNIEQSIIYYGSKIRKNKKRSSKLNIDDKVVFHIESSVNRNGAPYSFANIIRFVENKTLDKLIQEHTPEKEYYGFFKVNLNYFWVKEIDTHLRFHVAETFYPIFLPPEDNSLITFYLKVKKNGNAEAKLIKKIHNPEYKELRKKEVHAVIITQITEKYMNVKLKDLSFTGRIYYHGKCPYIEGEEIYALYAGLDKSGNLNFKTVL
jgi:hypothetical protein